MCSVHSCANFLFVNFVVCQLCLFSPRIGTLAGIQRLIELLFGEFERHADSGSYSSVHGVVKVLLMYECERRGVCTTTLFLSFRNYDSPWDKSFSPLNSQRVYLSLLLLSRLISLTFIPAASKKAEERIQGEASYLPLHLFPSRLIPFLSCHFHPQLSAVEQASHLLPEPHPHQPLFCCQHWRYCFCLSVTCPLFLAANP